MKKKIKDLTEEEMKGQCLALMLYETSHLNGDNFNIMGGKIKALTFNLKDFLDTEVDIPESHILDKKEHDYLSVVCKPFIEKIRYICKTIDMYEDCVKREKIIIQFKSEGGILSFPLFDRNSMYKGMELDKEYTIEELELDKEWEE